MVGDPHYLEKMGRELKCPICLSLLSSAVSLNCNHVFCNSCIVKSMKSDSNCPVCKVPYRRREVRSAPHMDNLVNIYKSMEIASGVNIFITQNATSTKLSDGKQQMEDHKDPGEQVSGHNCRDGVKKQKAFKGKESREEFNSNLKIPGSFQRKPSFPTKKRVQVPHMQAEGDLEETVGKLSKKSAAILREKPLDEKEPVLSPFFWLKEGDNVENLSQATGSDPFIDMPHPNAPSFSDIRDLDDENPSKLTPQGEVLGKSSNVADLFDSEMFEWTQRPCSPELCSSPFKKQVADTEELDVIQEEELKEASEDMKQGKEVPANDANDRAGGSNSKKRGRRARKITEISPAIENDNLPLAAYINLDKKSEDKLKTCKRSKKGGSCATGSKSTSENASAASARVETLDQGDKNMVTELPAFLEKSTSKKAGKSCKTRKQIQHPVRSEKQGLDTIQSDSDQASKKNNQTNEDTIAQLSYLFVPLANNEKASLSGDKPSKLSRKSNSSDHTLKRKRKSKISSSGNPKGETQAEHLNDLCANEAHITENIQGNLDARIVAEPSMVKKLSSPINNVVLQRCETIHSEAQCDFCLSSEKSEASGELVHYFNGKPVAADYNGGSKFIHSHKNCTEWAPNVYFEEDVAINLEAELTRSRRIKCSCCGNRGAALGCYDKSCRKSFHVTCAKLMPQCRWDMENFVMLCPLHASSKLPSECSESQAKKRKCNSKRQSSVQPNKVAVKHDQGTSSNWSSCGSSKKLFLCCSALTNSEREIVSEFEKVSGVTVLKKWESNVTHVIASTDDSGACKRTLKVLMGILDGKWILSIKWIMACMEALQIVDEESFEINVDSHGIMYGPRLGRLRVKNKQPKLFDGCNFYFMGDFEPSYKGYLQDLVTAAGGTILHRKPVSGGQKDLVSCSSTCQTFIIYSLELSDRCDLTKRNVVFDSRRSGAEALASSSGAKAVSNSWILNSIAACKLQSLPG